MLKSHVLYVLELLWECCEEEEMTTILPPQVLLHEGLSGSNNTIELFRECCLYTHVCVDMAVGMHARVAPCFIIS